MPEEIGSVTIYACRILHDGSFLIIDHEQQRLLLFSNEGIFLRIVVTFEGNPYDLCIVRNNTVAISFQTSTKSALVDIEKNKIIKTIELSHICEGVTSDGQILVISTTGTLDKKCTIVNLKDLSQKLLEGVEGNCILLFKENIYCTHVTKHTVSCYKRTGEPLWTFLHNHISFPSGLALDINGFIYVAFLGNNKIVVVSPDGKTSKTLLSKPDGIINPNGIDINRDTRMMIVSSKMNDDRANILVFKI
ncbi:unnamed protein product [Mytilus coruscus]|uniref:Uncharacterized protein n=1 Tax=Mytilus coruscus TaxID=42192 RepID=A0A6J7ZUP3_MYTCO|nr:unnamed protein product [Mytilus coruscus]